MFILKVLYALLGNFMIFGWVTISALLILGMKKVLYARSFVSLHTAFQQRHYFYPQER